MYWDDGQDQDSPHEPQGTAEQAASAEREPAAVPGIAVPPETDSGTGAPPLSSATLPFPPAPPAPPFPAPPSPTPAFPYLPTAARPNGRPAEGVVGTGAIQTAASATPDGTPAPLPFGLPKPDGTPAPLPGLRRLGGKGRRQSEASTAAPEAAIDRQEQLPDVRAASLSGRDGVPAPLRGAPLRAGVVARSWMLAGMAALLLIVATGGLLVANDKPLGQLLARSAASPSATSTATRAPTATATTTPTPTATPFATVPTSWIGQGYAPYVNAQAKYEIYVAPTWDMPQTSTQPGPSDGTYAYRDDYMPHTYSVDVDARLSIEQTDTLNHQSDILGNAPAPEYNSIQSGTGVIGGETCQKQQIDIAVSPARKALRFGCHHSGLGYYIYFECTAQAFDTVDRDIIEPMLDTLRFTS